MRRARARRRAYARRVEPARSEGGGLLLFSASGLVWAAILIPVQARQSRLLAESRDGPLPERSFVLARIWRYAGIVATLLPIGALVLMVTKPV